VLALLTTLLEIALLRKGPESIPRSPVVFLVAVGLWLLVDFASVLINPGVGMRQLLTGLAISIPGLLLYAVIVSWYGQPRRNLQMLTAVLGCGAMLGLLLTVALGIFVRPQTTGPVSSVALLVVWSIVLWSIVIEGHILSRTINQPRPFGVAIAFSVFLVQFYVSSIMSADTTAVS
jgi:hypothetical protein